ncbi:MAG: DNA repair protein RecN, partial [Clostridia bacterium]|nr:DNA repair protein RecN [Clostridia bacterium]
IDDAERSRRIDVLSFQIEEIQNAALKEGEEEELLSKRAKMNSVEKILAALQEAESALSADLGGLDALRTAKRAVNSVAGLDEAYAAARERLENLQAEAEDLADTLSSLQEDLYYDENEMERIERRLDEIKSLKRKYGGSPEEIATFLQRAQADYDLLINSGEEAEKLTAEISQHRKEIYSICRSITDLRKKAAKDFSSRVMQELKTLNIPSARFLVEFDEYSEEDCDKATSEGLVNARFLFSANAGEPVKPLSKIISGGEMSRFMLAVKTQLSEVNGISTYIFDEIDAGISGQTAKVVAEKFAKIAKNTQILAVSHLAQIACMADREFLIEKKETNGKTITHVTQLEEDGRIRELVRLLGGDAQSEFALKHAEELIENAKEYKKILS